MKILAKLAPKTCTPTDGGGKSSLRPLSAQDVAHVLAGLPEHINCLMRAVYGGDYGQSNVRVIYLATWQHAIRQALKHGWKYQPEQLYTMAIIAADSMIYPQNTLCPHCGGSGHVQPNQHNTTGICRLCNATGSRPGVDAVIAESLGVTHDEWQKVWSARYARVIGALQGWHASGSAHVRERSRHV